MVKKFRIYVDGSFSKDNYKVIGEDRKGITHGGIIYWDIEKDEPMYMAHVKTTSQKLVSMCNVGGELLAAYLAIKSVSQSLLENGHTKDSVPAVLELVFDFVGIKNWITGEWVRTNSSGSSWYKTAVNGIINTTPNLRIDFIWVPGHTGEYGNELADKVANWDTGYCQRNNVPILEINDL